MVTRSFIAAVLLLCSVAFASIIPSRATLLGDPKLATPVKLPANLSASGVGTDPVQAFASYEMVSNGFTTQEEFLSNFADFSEITTPEKGLGPTHNNVSCQACHPNGNGSRNPVTRVGSMRTGVFTTPAGGSLIRLFAVNSFMQQHVPSGFEIQTEIISPTLRGMGLINLIPDNAIKAVNDAQPVAMRGTLVVVNVVTAFNADGTPNTTQNRYGRFFRKCFHGVVLEGVADALRNEIGPTSPLQPTKAPAVNGDTLASGQKSANVLDNPPTPTAPMGQDVFTYTRFINALPAPPRKDRNNKDVSAGEQLFNQALCSVCHVPTWQTAPAGSSINGIPSIPASLAGQTFNPYSDFTTHYVANEDGIQQGPAPRNEVRTTPLWGLSIRTHYWHDGRVKTLSDAINLHGGQALPSQKIFATVFTVDQQNQLIAFLGSL